MAEFFKRLRCMVGKHSPSRRSVRYEGHLKIGPCKYCGRQLEKGGDGRWVTRHLTSSAGKPKVIEED